MERAFRYDHGELRTPVRTPDGFLRVEGFVARPGIYEYVNTPADEKKGYGKAGTIRRELRPEEELFRDEVLTAYEGAPLTARHPKTPVTPKNVRAFEVGAAGRARRVGNRVATSMLIKDPKTIEAVEGGKLTQLSPGYTSMIHKTPGADKRYGYAGNPEGTYDVVQRDIEVNHLALCEAARGGADLEIRMDGYDDFACEMPCERVEPTVFTTAVEGHQHSLDPSAPGGSTSWARVEGQDTDHSHEWTRLADGSISIAENAGHTHAIDNATLGLREDANESRSAPLDIEQGEVMSLKTDTEMSPDEQIRALKAQLDGVTKERDQRQDALTAAEAQRDAERAKVTTLTEKVTSLETQLAAGATAMETEAIAEQARRADSAELELSKLKATRETEIRKAAEVRAKAMTLMGPEFRVDDMSDRTIQSVVIKKYAPKEDTGEKVSNAYIETRFDSIYQDRMRTARSFTRVGEALAGTQVRETRADSAGRSGPDLSTREGRAKAWHEQALNPPKEA